MPAYKHSRRPKGEGQISLLPSGKYMARLNTKNGRISKTLDTRPLASAWIREQMRADEKTLAFKDITLFQYIENWIDLYKKDHVAPKTYEMYIYSFGLIKKFSNNDKLLQEVTKEDAQKIINNAVRNGHAFSTVNKIKLVLKQIYNQAMEDDIVKKNIINKISMPTNNSPKVHALTKEEQKKVEKVAFEFEQGDLIVFLLHTGLRIGEALNLAWNDVNLNSKEIRIVKSKTSSGIRTIPLNNMALAILRHRKESGKKGYVFQTGNGNQLGNNNRRLCQRVAKAAGVKSFSPHVCRHSFATRLLEKGANMKTVADLLGHANVQMAMNVYSDVFPLLKEQTVSLLDED